MSHFASTDRHKEKSNYSHSKMKHLRGMVLVEQQVKRHAVLSFGSHGRQTSGLEFRLQCEEFAADEALSKAYFSCIGGTIL